MTDATLNADHPRPRRRPRPTVDVVVIGLGITGAGVALDAATRGLSVLAVDAHDLAFGTSRWSLQAGARRPALPRQGQVGVAHESAVERGILMEVTAPHLTHAMPMLMPLSSGVAARQAALARGGLLAGDLLRRGAAHQPRDPAPAAPALGDRGAARWPPSLRRDGLRGAPALLGRPARGRRPPGHHGRPHRGGARRPRPHPRPGRSPRPARRCELRDELHRRDPRRSAPARSSTPPASGRATWSTRSRLRPSRGTHLVLRERDPARACRSRCTRPSRAPATGSCSCCPSPTAPSTSASPTSRSTATIPDVPEPTEPEIGFLLDVVSAAFAAPLRRTDVVGAYAGLRPLLDTGDGDDRRPLPQARRAHLAAPAW